MAKRSDFKSIDQYIKTFPEHIQEKLSEMRSIIHKAAPEAEEAISYQIPVFKQFGSFVGYFAGFKNHISFYPIPPLDGDLQKEVEPYVAGKGTLRFPLDKPLPEKLITNLVKTWVRIKSQGKKNY